MNRYWKKHQSWYAELINCQTELGDDLTLYLPFLTETADLIRLLDLHEQQHPQYAFVSVEDVFVLVKYGVDDDRIIRLLRRGLFDHHVGYVDLEDVKLAPGMVRDYIELGVDPKLIELMKKSLGHGA